MSAIWNARFAEALHRGEVLSLYFTTALLIVLEFCLVYWLHQIQIPDRDERVGSSFIVMPPWYQKPRFEVTLMLIILAGLLFSVCRGLWDLSRKRADAASRGPAVQSVKRHVKTATAVAALAGIDLVLVTWLRS